jgi:hypothetical protein
MLRSLATISVAEALDRLHALSGNSANEITIQGINRAIGNCPTLDVRESRMVLAHRSHHSHHSHHSHRSHHSSHR